MLFEHGVNDSRVDVWMTLKTGSRVAAATTSGKPGLMRSRVGGRPRRGCHARAVPVRAPPTAGRSSSGRPARPNSDRRLAVLLAPSHSPLASPPAAAATMAVHPARRADFRVVAGDASVIVTWTAEPDVDYWIFFEPGANVDLVELGHDSAAVAITIATSPRIITGLANGVITRSR